MSATVPNLEAALCVLDRRADHLKSRLETIEKRRVAVKNPQWGSIEHDAVSEEMDALRVVLASARTAVAGGGGR